MGRGAFGKVVLVSKKSDKGIKFYIMYLVEKYYAMKIMRKDEIEEN